MGRINYGAKPWIVPMPVLIIGTYDENGIPNAMNAAWGMISDMNEVTISMSPHKTTANLEVTKAFTVSMATADTVVACDYVGEIVNVSVDESVLTDGKIDMAKLNPIAYNPITHAYVTFGETVGTAFSDGMKLKTNS